MISFLLLFRQLCYGDSGTNSLGRTRIYMGSRVYTEIRDEELNDMEKFPIMSVKYLK